MPKAIWNGAVLAESDKTIMVEGNHYFPSDSINPHYFHKSEARSVCPWKGTAAYYDLEVAGQVNRGAAWTYPDPKAAANHIKGYVAFWKGVEIQTVQTATHADLPAQLPGR